MPTSRSRPGTTPSWKTGSTSATWCSWAVCATTGTQSGASRAYYFADTDGDLTWFPRLSSGPGFNSPDPTASAAGCVRGGPVAAACVSKYAGLVEDQSHNYLSPHIQVSFPVTERTNFRLSYAHQVQAPDFALILRRHQHRPRQHQHQPGVRLRPRLRQDDHLRVRHPARVQRRHGARRLGLQQGQAVRCRGPPGSRSAIRRRGSNIDIRVLTNADFGNVRGVDVRLDRRYRRTVQRHAGLHLPAGQEHRLRSVHLHQLRFAGIVNQVGGGNRAAAAGHPADHQQPAAQPGGRAAR